MNYLWRLIFETFIDSFFLQDANGDIFSVIVFSCHI